MSCQTPSLDSVQCITTVSDDGKSFVDANGQTLVLEEELESPKLEICERFPDVEDIVRNDGGKKLTLAIQRNMVRGYNDGSLRKGIFEKVVVYEDGKVLEASFHYLPSDKNEEWSVQHFSVNPAEYHEAECRGASILRRMFCACRIRDKTV